MLLMGICKRSIWKNGNVSVRQSDDLQCKGRLNFGRPFRERDISVDGRLYHVGDFVQQASVRFLPVF